MLFHRYQIHPALRTTARLLADDIGMHRADVQCATFLRRGGMMFMSLMMAMMIFMVMVVRMVHDL
jgi:hypothetical protein